MTELVPVKSYSQCGINLSKSLLCLFEKAENNGVAELAIAWLVHLQNLLESVHVDVIAELDLVDGFGLGLVSDQIRLDAHPVSSPP